MLLFCPLCSNALTVGQGEMGLDFVCETCSYVHQIEQKITNRVYYKLKELDDVLGGKVWKYVGQVVRKARLKGLAFCQECHVVRYVLYFTVCTAYQIPTRHILLQCKTNIILLGAT